MSFSNRLNFKRTDERLKMLKYDDFIKAQEDIKHLKL